MNNPDHISGSSKTMQNLVKKFYSGIKAYVSWEYQITSPFFAKYPVKYRTGTWLHNSPLDTLLRKSLLKFSAEAKIKLKGEKEEKTYIFFPFCQRY